jgi:hypothetical protein
VSTLVTITVPATFYDDHCERMSDNEQADCGREYGRKAHRVCIGITEAGLAELLADARYYAKDVDSAPEHIVASARRTVHRIESFQASERARLAMKARHGGIA